MTARWRPMRAANLPAVATLADRVHVEHPEAPAVFAERLDLFPAGCFTLAQGAAVIGYAIAHPARSDAPPALNTMLGKLPDDADCLYLHDIALAPEARHQGHGADLLARMVELARQHGLANLALIAVSGSGPFWRRLDFRPCENASISRKLASYGAEAAYMVRRLTRTKMPDGL